MTAMAGPPGLRDRFLAASTFGLNRCGDKGRVGVGDPVLPKRTRRAAIARGLGPPASRLCSPARDRVPRAAALSGSGVLPISMCGAGACRLLRGASGPVA